MIGWTREVIELANLALARFAGLTESELKVLVAVTTGGTAYCGPSEEDNHPHNNPDLADFWGLERDVRAELLRWLCINRDAAAWIDARGLRIHAARITGQLDLRFAIVRTPLFLIRCRITDAINLPYAQIELLQLSGTLVPGLSADGIRVRGALNLIGGFRSDGEVRLLGAGIGGSLDCSGGEFVKPDGYALYADGVNVAGSVFLRNGFGAQGEVRLVGADIGSNLECVGGKFVTPGGCALNADGVKVTGDVFLSDGFRAEGQIRMLGADIGGDLSCIGGKFMKPGGDALSADRVKVAGSVLLHKGFSAQGEVCLLGANIGGDLSVTNAEFAVGSRLNAERATVKGVLFWTGLGHDDKGLKRDVDAALNLGHASVGPIADDQDSWPTRGNLNLDGFVYTRIATDPTDAKSRLDWLARQPADQFTPQPYQQLAKVLREAGDNVGARQVLIAMENSRHEHGKLGALARRWHWVLWATIGYGYRPWQALCWGFGFVMLGFLLFRHGYYEGAITPSDKDAFSTFEVHHPKLHHGNPPPYYPRFSPLVYSLDAFLPIISFGQKDHWMPNPNIGRWGYWLRVYQWIFHVGLGWVLTTLFVAGLTPIVRSG